MKTRILTIAIILFSALTALAGNSVDALFNRVKNLPHAEYANEKLSKSVAKGAIDGIKTIETAEAHIGPKAYQELRDEITKNNYKPYEPVIDTRDGDEVVKILIKNTKKKITEVVIIDLEKDEISLVRFKGNLKSDMFTK